VNLLFTLDRQQFLISVACRMFGRLSIVEGTARPSNTCFVGGCFA
jgi:hypothetical protein